MAFYGCEFLFDDVSCSQHGLMLYDFGSNTQGDNSFPSAGKIISDSVAGRYDSFFYGVEQNEPMEYTLVFGANMDSIDAVEHIDRYEVEAIASWLTGHNTRKWLEIVQPDMESFRYKCTISDLKLITYGNMPWAFSCKVTCDSPFAYTHEDHTFIDLEAGDTYNGSEFIYFNRSSYNGYYCPKMIIRFSGGGRLSIRNRSDENRQFLFDNLPKGDLEIHIDNLNQVIYEKNTEVNLYPYFNFNFLRLKRGDNVLSIYKTHNSTCEIEIISSFPVNIGA